MKYIFHKYGQCFYNGQNAHTRRIQEGGGRQTVIYCITRVGPFDEFFITSNAPYKLTLSPFLFIKCNTLAFMQIFSHTGRMVKSALNQVTLAKLKLSVRIYLFQKYNYYLNHSLRIIKYLSKLIKQLNVYK